MEKIMSNVICEWLHSIFSRNSEYKEQPTIVAPYKVEDKDGYTGKVAAVKVNDDGTISRSICYTKTGRGRKAYKVLNEAERISLYLSRNKHAVPYAELARRYGVSESTARNICKG